MSWTDDCPMLKREYIAFLKSKKLYMLAYKDKYGEYCSKFLNEEPNEDIFIESKKQGDYCMAIFKRNFDIEVDYTNINTMKKSLILIDESVY